MYPMKNWRHSHNVKRRATALSVLFAFVLQVLVPIGYMPASYASEGSLIKLCPTGLSDEMMMVLHPGHHHHHHAHHMADGIDDSHAQNDGYWQDYCPYGASASGDYTIEASSSAEQASPAAIQLSTLQASDVLAKRFRQQSPRAPPVNR